jgi:putative Mg2+ transporter-C (MgtC) family protein
MSPHLTAIDVLLRLGVALAAGVVIGFDRGEHGKPAGLRTTILVCLAAAMAMVLANYLLATSGKSGISFAQIDPMRLPLGILTGVGFIGAGTIIQRRDLVVGVTTAATLWFITVVGLCAGAGYIALALCTATLGVAILWGLPVLERLIPRERQATLELACTGDRSIEQDLVGRLHDEGYLIVNRTLALTEAGSTREVRFELRWRALRSNTEPPGFLTDLAHLGGVISLRWLPAAI